MSWAHEVLGIAPEAETVEVKRAYARLLKQTRPDDDPAGFQRLHEAFLECLAHRRRVEAGEPDPYAWEDGEDEDEAAAQDDDSPDEERQSPEVTINWDEFEAAWKREQFEEEVTSAPKPGNEAAALLDEIFEAAHREADRLDTWLRVHDGLYSISLKRELGEAILPRLVQEQETLSWRAVDAIFTFFEYDSVSDPRLRARPLARELWQETRGHERFHKHLSEQRQLHYGATFVDRLVDRELFEAPHRGRRMAIQWLPLVGASLRQKLQQLQELDKARAYSALSPAARDFWPPIFDPARLHWRRFMPVMLQLALLTAILIGMASIGREGDKRGLVGLWGVFFLVLAGIYWVFTLWRFGVNRYYQWRIAKWGRGDAPAGASILADPPSVILLLIALGSVAIALLTIGHVNAGAIWLFYFQGAAMWGRIRASARLRWEEPVFVICAAAALWPLLGWIKGAAVARDNWFQSLVLATGTAILALLAVDVIESRVRDLSLAEVRDRPSWPLAGGALVAIALTVSYYAG